MSVEESNRLARIARICTLAVETFGDEESARRWLGKPLRRFANRSPMDMLVTETGTHEVEDLLGRISHGQAA